MGPRQDTDSGRAVVEMLQQSANMAAAGPVSVIPTDTNKSSTVLPNYSGSTIEQLPAELLFKILKSVLACNEPLAPVRSEEDDRKIDYHEKEYENEEEYESICDDAEFEEEYENACDPKMPTVGEDFYSVTLTCKLFLAIGSQVFFQSNTFYEKNLGNPRPCYARDRLVFGKWISSLTPINRQWIRSIVTNWILVPKQNPHLPAEYKDGALKIQEEIFSKLALLINLSSLEIVTLDSIVGHPIITQTLHDTEFQYTESAYGKGGFSGMARRGRRIVRFPVTDQRARRAWMGDIEGAVELKSLPMLKNITIRGQDKLSGLAIREYLGGPPIPPEVKRNQKKYGWREFGRNSRGRLANMHHNIPYGTTANKLVFTIPGR